MANQTSPGAAAGGCLIAIVWIVLGPIINGWVLTWLWKWFAIPFAAKQGYTLVELTIPLAIGIATIVAFLTHQMSTIDDEYEKPALERLWGIILAPFITLLFGWIVQHWV